MFYEKKVYLCHKDNVSKIIVADSSYISLLNEILEFNENFQIKSTNAAIDADHTKEFLEKYQGHDFNKNMSTENVESFIENFNSFAKLGTKFLIHPKIEHSVQLNNTNKFSSSFNVSENCVPFSSLFNATRLLPRDSSNLSPQENFVPFSLLFNTTQESNNNDLASFPLIDDTNKIQKNYGIHIVFNTAELITLCIKKDHSRWYAKELIKDFKEFEIVEFIACSKSEESTLFECFHFKPFNSIVNVKTKINIAKMFVDDEKENHHIKKHIKENYIISQDVSKKMKASDLFNHIKSTFSDAYSFSNCRFSGILLSLGLQRKRQSDAVYYYGIEYKFEPSSEAKKIIEDCELERLTEQGKYFETLRLHGFHNHSQMNASMV